ncbi:LytTR family DNA-binding domain-containing protein [Ruminococcaceae bacterium OttesenSCG-928-I18]|nr:LytTR family DNA-binding domain-containing protein [Ruminococcaceae bacterium OttesenSCG-928-I18]
MIRIAICDDTAMEAEYLSELLEEYKSPLPHLPLRVERFESAEALQKAVRETGEYHIYLLDIILPGMDGVELARTLVQDEPKPSILFLTNSEEYAVEAFSIHAVDYLVKPVQKSRLYAVMDDVVRAAGRRMESTTFLKTPHMDTPVKLADIVAVEVTGHTLRYLLTEGRQYHSKALRISFEEATKDLAKDPRFLRPHRSYLINMVHVEKLGKYQFTMQGGIEIPISRLRFAEIKKAYLHFLSKTGID